MARLASVLLRRANPDDVDAVLAVGHRTWPPTYEPIAGADYVTMGLAKWWSRDATLSAIESGRVTVAEVDGQVVGVATAGPHDGGLVLWKLYVLPQFQGVGIGSRLLDAVMEAARGVYPDLRLAYLDGNDVARDFYAGKGFAEVGREAGSGGLPDTIWMTRAVGEP